MSEPTIEHAAASVVIVGHMNPAIFQPSWLRLQELITAADLQAQDLKIVHAEMSQFSIGGWCDFAVTPTRFSALTWSTERDEELRTLVLGVFSALRHTPMSALGINWSWHYNVGTPERWHRVGHTLVPKDSFWNHHVPQAGMLNLSVIGAMDAIEGQVQVDVQPSSRIKGGHGVFVNANRQFPLKKGSSFADLERALSDQWTFTKDKAKTLTTELMRFTLDDTESNS